MADADEPSCIYFRFHFGNGRLGDGSSDRAAGVFRRFRVIFPRTPGDRYSWASRPVNSLKRRSFEICDVLFRPVSFVVLLWSIL
jgi:hypothetical protein